MLGKSVPGTPARGAWPEPRVVGGRGWGVAEGGKYKHVGGAPLVQFCVLVKVEAGELMLWDPEDRLGGY